MLTLRIRQAIFIALIAACAPLGAGCYVEVPPPVPIDGYEPVYYDGYLVYYDIDGTPYYYADGSRYYVPRTYVHYDVLLHHYRTHYRPYRHWYVRDGYRYKGYRRVDRPHYHRR